MKEFSIVGKSIPRIDAREKATGKAMFTEDFTMPRMLYGQVLRSPYTHARITRLDTSEAEKVPGVRVVVTAKDVPPVRFSTSVEDQYALPCDNIVRKVDDPVAMYLSDIFTLPVNIAGLPGMSVPSGFVDVEGRDLPVGLQVIAKPFDELTLLRVADAYERATDWSRRRPAL